VGVYVQDKTEALQELVQSVHKGQENQIKQSLESLLTAIALECDPGQVNTLKNFVNSIKVDRDMLIDKTGGRQEIRFNLTNYGYQLD